MKSEFEQLDRVMRPSIDLHRIYLLLLLMKIVVVCCCEETVAEKRLVVVGIGWMGGYIEAFGGGNDQCD